MPDEDTPTYSLWTSPPETWRGLSTPSPETQEALRDLEAAVKRMMDDPEFQAKLEARLKLHRTRPTGKGWHEFIY